jgi:hypothetical protein
MTSMTPELRQIIRLKAVVGAKLTIHCYPRHAAEIAAMIRRDAVDLLRQRTVLVRAVAADKGEPA